MFLVKIFSSSSSFVSENLIETCNRWCLGIPEKQIGTDTNPFDDEVVAVFDNVLKNKCNTKTQH